MCIWLNLSLSELRKTVHAKIRPRGYTHTECGSRHPLSLLLPPLLLSLRAHVHVRACVCACMGACVYADVERTPTAMPLVGRIDPSSTMHVYATPRELTQPSGTHPTTTRGSHAFAICVCVTLTRRAMILFSLPLILSQLCQNSYFIITITIVIRIVIHIGISIV